MLLFLLLRVDNKPLAVAICVAPPPPEPPAYLLIASSYGNEELEPYPPEPTGR